MHIFEKMTTSFYLVSILLLLGESLGLFGKSQWYFPIISHTFCKLIFTFKERANLILITMTIREIQWEYHACIVKSNRIVSFTKQKISKIFTCHFRMARFHQENITATSGISALLVDRLTNELPLSLYFDGMLSHISSNGKRTEAEQLF